MSKAVENLLKAQQFAMSIRPKVGGFLDGIGSIMLPMLLAVAGPFLILAGFFWPRQGPLVL